MAGQFDRIVEELYNKVALDKGYCDEVLSEEGLEYFKKLIEFYEKPEIIESYQNGSSWYRVYRDGWCEQGSTVNVTQLGTTITLFKAYTSTDYQLSFAMQDPSGDASLVAAAWRSKSTSSFIVDTGFNGTYYGGKLDWRACGYIF